MKKFSNAKKKPQKIVYFYWERKTVKRRTKKFHHQIKPVIKVNPTPIAAAAAWYKGRGT